MFERFTDDARAVLVRAQEQAVQLRHDFVGAEHFLLAMSEDVGPVGQLFRSQGLTPPAVLKAIGNLAGARLFEDADREALASLGIDLAAVTSRVEAIFGPNALGDRARRRRRRPGIGGAMPLTRNALTLLERSLREAQAQHAGRLGVEHLALAVTSQEGGPVAAICSALGVSTAGLRADLLGGGRRAG